MVRVTDTAGNVVERGPYPVLAGTPSDRGAFNGAGATETGTMSAVWTVNGKNARRTLSYGTKAGVRGRLLNSDGQPITGAKVVMLTPRPAPGRPADPAHDGHHRPATAASAPRSPPPPRGSSSSRGSRAPTTSASPPTRYLTLQARASSTLKVSTRRPRVGRTLTISGTLRGVSRGGVPVVVQGKAKNARRYETFADTTSSPSGRFKVTYRFRSSASRGRSFVFRARIRPSARFPYETGYSQTVTVRVR